MISNELQLSEYVTVVDHGEFRDVQISGIATPWKKWRTKYSLPLIEQVLNVKGPRHLCDELRRDEDSTYVEHHFKFDIFGYVDPVAFDGARILDFGCGCGASSMVLARTLPPTARIAGVELVEEFVKLANQRAHFYGVQDRVTFHLSPGPNQLPNFGEFDFIVLSAVFEHLLPLERKTVLPLLWSRLKPGGVLFLDQTPFRWFPIETHTTGLPLINYLPDVLAYPVAKALSKRLRDNDWETMRRRGIRGGTPRQIVRLLGPDAILMEPSRLGLTDRIGLWSRLSGQARWPTLKLLLEGCFRVVRLSTGLVVVPNLSLALRKRK